MGDKWGWTEVHDSGACLGIYKGVRPPFGSTRTVALPPLSNTTPGQYKEFKAMDRCIRRRMANRITVMLVRSHSEVNTV